MPAIVLVGAQWGDEGKGKATDLMGGDVDYVVKFNGGNNAGHTRRHRGGTGGGEVRAAPAALRHPHPEVYAGHRQRRRRRPRVLFDEIDGLEARGVDTSRLVVCANAHVIAPYNRTLDKVTERFLGRAGSAPPAAASARRTPTRCTASASGCRTSSTRTSCGRRSRRR